MLVFAVSIFDIAFEQQKFILRTPIQIKLRCNFFSFDGNVVSKLLNKL